jgi:hypothetical protein
VAAGALEKRLGGTGQRGKMGRRGCVRVEAGEGGEGGGLSTTVSSVGRPATALDHQARVASLPHERGRANVADERDRGEAGPGGSGQGAREKERMRQGGSGPPTCGPRRHSVERCDSNRI